MEKKKRTLKNNGEPIEILTDVVKSGGFAQVIGGGTAVVRGKKPTFTASNAKNGNEEIVTDPFGSWTGVPVDDPYEKPIQDADDL